MDALGATSASLVHASDERMAGFNLYELSDDGALGAFVAADQPARRGVYRRPDPLP